MSDETLEQPPEPERTRQLRQRAAQPLDDRPDARATPLPDVDLTRIGRFLVVGRLGAGGMGQVYSAYDPELDRKVAIKLVRSRPDDSPATRARIKREAQALARISDPNVVNVYEVGEAEGGVFIAMEIVDGIALRAWQRERDTGSSQGVAVVLRMYLQAADGLLAAHRVGLIHRDFKPDNAIVGADGRLRVVDFGIARVVADAAPAASAASTASGAPSATTPADGPVSAPAALPQEEPRAESADPRRSQSGERLTERGAILGTPGYMAPEQVSGADADERSDQFGFCASLYEALYGQPAFAGRHFEAYARSVLLGQARTPPPSHVPVVVQAAILRGLAIDPTARFASMQELITALEAGLSPESESHSLRVDRVRLALRIALWVVALAVSNALLGVLTRDRSALLRGMGAAGLLLASGVVLRMYPPRIVRRPTRYRRMMDFFIVTFGFMMVSRGVGWSVGVAPTAYFATECVGLAGLMALESLHVGRAHALVVPLPLLAVLLLRWVPEKRLLFLNVIYCTLAAASVYLHLRPTHRAAPATSEERARSDRKRRRGEDVDTTLSGDP